MIRDVADFLRTGGVDAEPAVPGPVVPGPTARQSEEVRPLTDLARYASARRHPSVSGRRDVDGTEC
jgi:hypothetical protein